MDIGRIVARATWIEFQWLANRTAAPQRVWTSIRTAGNSLQGKTFWSGNLHWADRRNMLGVP